MQLVQHMGTLAAMPVAGDDGHAIAEWRQRVTALIAELRGVRDARDAAAKERGFRTLVNQLARDGMPMSELATLVNASPADVERALGLDFEPRTVNHQRIVKRVSG